MNRRTMIGRSALAAGGFAVGVGFTAPSCGTPKNLSSWVTMIVAAFGEIKPLLGELGLGTAVLDRVSGFIDKAAKIARDFDAAYRAGKFQDAATLFVNLGDVIAQIAADLGATDNRIVKLALISISIARIAIASLLNAQAPAVAEAVSAARTGGKARVVTEIERLANLDISKIEKAIP
jgi:hypothetical protein